MPSEEIKLANPWIVRNVRSNVRAAMQVELEITLVRHGSPYFPAWAGNALGRSLEDALAALLASDQSDLPSWFAEHVLPHVSPEMIPALQARLMARRMGGVIPGPLALPES